MFSGLYLKLTCPFLTFEQTLQTVEDVICIRVAISVLKGNLTVQRGIANMMEVEEIWLEKLLPYLKCLSVTVHIDYRQSVTELRKYFSSWSLCFRIMHFKCHATGPGREFRSHLEKKS